MGSNPTATALTGPTEVTRRTGRNFSSSALQVSHYRGDPHDVSPVIPASSGRQSCSRMAWRLRTTFGTSSEVQLSGSGSTSNANDMASMIAAAERRPS